MSHLTEQDRCKIQNLLNAGDLPREIAVFDKAYVDFKHLNALDERGIFWVTRKKENMAYEVMGQHT
ncbi:MAG: hypothetical protein PHR12_09275, partial [Victivallaceae bacterium]|nr:hypothetical protein [Victivallaceae bacterium]MDD3704404.1 hypothetical protein [Victivallaceae bacterium]